MPSPPPSVRAGAPGLRVVGASDRLARLALSPRQRDLNALWARYRCVGYAGRKIDWNGNGVLDPSTLDAVTAEPTLPLGFVRANKDYPLNLRRPTAPYRLTKVVVDRFTGLLFSARMRPTLVFQGDDMVGDRIAQIVDGSGLWPAMIRARTFGGAQGTAVAGIVLKDGRPRVQIHDPRWCRPDWLDRSEFELRAVEIRYQYPQEVETIPGVWDEIPTWYRRVIGDAEDVVYKPIVVGEGDEPRWTRDDERSRRHDLGECPVVWAQNMPVEDAIDGDPDCQGAYEMAEAIDALIAQANRGTIYNADPTLGLFTDAKLADVKKGSDNAIKLPQGSRIEYLEITGTGPKMAMEIATELRIRALEVVQCVLDADVGDRATATEVERKISSMLAKADILREQYGRKLVIPLVRKMLRAMLSAAENPNTFVRIPGEREPAGALAFLRRAVAEVDLLGEQSIQLRWPRYFEGTLDDGIKAATMMTSLKAAGLITDDAAVEFMAEHVGVRDPQAMINALREQREEQQVMLEAMTIAAMKVKGEAT